MFLSGGWGLHATFLRVVGVDQRAKRVHGVDPVFTLYSSEYADICFSFGSCPIVPLSVPTTKSSAFGNAGMSFFPVFQSFLSESLEESRRSVYGFARPFGVGVVFRARAAFAASQAPPECGPYVVAPCAAASRPAARGRWNRKKGANLNRQGSGCLVRGWRVLWEQRMGWMDGINRFSWCFTLF